MTESGQHVATKVKGVDVCCAERTLAAEESCDRNSRDNSRGRPRGFARLCLPLRVDVLRK